MNNSFSNLPNDKKIILFDGVCNFCNFWVNYVIEKDKNDLFRFASLQSELGKSVLRQLNLSENILDTFVLLDEKKYFLRSTAALKVVKDIKSWLKVLYPLIILPGFLRDWVYNLVAKNRYKIFGKSEFCRIPSEEEKSKFIE